MTNDDLIGAIAKKITEIFPEEALAAELLDRRLYNAKGSAELLGISRSTFYRIKDLIPAVVIDQGVPRWRGSDLKAFAESRKTDIFL